MPKNLALLALFLTLFVSYSCFKTIRTKLEQKEPVPAIVKTIYVKSAVETYYPNFANLFAKDWIELRWKLNFAPVSVILGLIAAMIANTAATILFVPPSRSMVEDPEYKVQHAGIDTPRLCHLEDILYVVPPRNIAIIEEDILIGGMDPYAPVSQSVNVTDRPIYLENPPAELKAIKKK